MGLLLETDTKEFVVLSDILGEDGSHPRVWMVWRCFFHLFCPVLLLRLKFLLCVQHGLALN